MQTRPNHPAPVDIPPEALDVAALPDRSRHAFACEIATGEADAGLHEVPILVLRGDGPGPRLMVVGGVHGDEAEGIALGYALWDGLGIDDFRGTMVILPIAHMAAFRAGQRRSPIDGLDLNRVCPGDPLGAPTERLAAGLARIIRGNADFLFTLHGWYATGRALPHVEFDIAPSAGQAASRRACFSAGFAHVVAADWPPGLLPKVAVAAGVPAMEAEIGGLAATDRGGVAFLRDRVIGLMGHLGMLHRPREAGPPEGAVRRHLYVTAPVPGILDCAVEIGDEVGAGAPLARIHDVYGRELARIDAPAAGLVATRRCVQRVAAGEDLVTLLVAPEALP